MSLLQLKDLTLKLSGRPILNGINAVFRENHVHAVVGPNGAGKSTLASTIMGLSGYRKISGDILFNGDSILDWSVDERSRRGITLGWQDPARFEGLTVQDYLAASARGREKDKIAEVLEMFGFDPAVWLKRSVDRTLSGGERKKIELASLLLMDARLVLLDEPDSGIDVEALDRIFDAIRMMKQRGNTVVLITHSAAVLRQADYAFLMCHGTILEHGPTPQIMPYFENKCIPCGYKGASLETFDAELRKKTRGLEAGTGA